MNCRDELHHHYTCKAGILRKSPVKPMHDRRVWTFLSRIIIFLLRRHWWANGSITIWSSRCFREQIEQKPDAILIEDAGFGTALISTLKQRKLPVVAVKPEGDKKTRLLRQISKFTNRQVFILKTAPGRSELEDELFSFPGGRRNDLVDALTQALGYNHVPFRLDRRRAEELRKPSRQSRVSWSAVLRPRLRVGF